MLDNFDEIAFKAVTYPIIVELYKAADELAVVQAKEDCEQNCAFLFDWIKSLDTITRFAHQSIENYTAPLGYHVVAEKTASENLDTFYSN